MPPRMTRHLPNQLTLLRLLLAGLFFLTLNQYRYPVDQHGSSWLALAMLLFVLAASTDILDGYLARKWKVESTFGRIMDPFCDKVLILGTFTYLCGPRFIAPEAANSTHPPSPVSGVYPWMTVLMLARELLVTSLRGTLDDRGEPFGANLFGKLKMILQSIGVPAILLIVWLDPATPGLGYLVWIRDVWVYAIVAVTVLSGIPYVRNAWRVLTETQRRPAGAPTPPTSGTAEPQAPSRAR